MDDVYSIRRIAEIVLAVLGMVFFLVEGVKGMILILSIMVVAYLGLVSILAIARRGDILGGGGSFALDCIFGVLITLHTTNFLAYEKAANLTLAGLIIECVLGVMLLLSTVF